MPASARTSPPVPATSAPTGSSCWRGQCPQPRDQQQDVREHLPRYRDFGKLECDVAVMADDLRADLDQLLLEAGQRPRLCCLWHRQCAHEITQIVGQGMKLKTHGI